MDTDNSVETDWGGARSRVEVVNGGKGGSSVILSKIQINFQKLINKIEYKLYVDALEKIYKIYLAILVI